ncbi:hypothetical protein R3P38DRAFT_3165082 [Favolaschia claudopus]|uniref:Uncharacterized protein n=1 Tax=Favolaschia claudopus TaxID=2862362 RepID=A0AAW0EGJ4_9AGAR
MSGQIFNVDEPKNISEFQTTAAQAQAEAKTGALAREVEANAEQAKDVALNAAFVAQAKVPELTGQSATDRLTTEASVKTGQAVNEGQRSVEEAKVAGAGYVEQAKSMASSTVAAAQSYMPAGSGPNNSITTGDVVSGLQAGANAAYVTGKQILSTAQETAQPYINSAATAAQPHLEKARDVAASYLPGSTTTQTAPVEGNLGKDTPRASIPYSTLFPCIIPGADNDDAPRQAAQEHPEDEEHYKRAARHAAENTDDHRPVSDEEVSNAKEAHQKIYKDNNKDNLERHGSDAVGGAVVTEVMQKVMASGGDIDIKSLMPLVMSEASKLLGGNADPGFKGEVMQKVTMLALKSQLSSGGGGGGGMASLLNKFL